MMNPTFTPDTRPCARCGQPARQHVHVTEYDRFYCKACRFVTTEPRPQADSSTHLRLFVDRMFANSEGAR